MSVDTASLKFPKPERKKKRRYAEICFDDIPNQWQGATVTGADRGDRAGGCTSKAGVVKIDKTQKHIFQKQHIGGIMKSLADYEYYRTELGVLYCGDNEKILPLLKEPIDLILTDPPYNAKNIGPNKKEYDNTKMQLSDKDYKAFCERWFSQCLKITDKMIFTPGISNICFYPQPHWIFCWYKPASVSFNRYGGFNGWEPVSFYGKVKGKYGNDILKHDTLNFMKGPEKDHPCPKVMTLWHELLYKNKEQIILDPFIGSGTTGVVCEMLNRKWIGIEISEKYCEIAKKRISTEANQLKLFK
jgi:16S rRNA G966 N2-methylase RsmD